MFHREKPIESVIILGLLSIKCNFKEDVREFSDKFLFLTNKKKNTIMKIKFLKRCHQMISEV